MVNSLLQQIIYPMKWVRIILFSIVVALYSCNQQTDNSGSNNISKLLSPEAILTEIKAKNTPKELAAGQKIEMEACGKCHVHYPPDIHTLEEWEGVLPKMVKHAKLAPADAARLRAYLLVNCKQ